MADGLPIEDTRTRCLGCRAKLKVPENKRARGSFRCPRCGLPVKTLVSPGTQMGDYTIVRPVAAGSMGEVYAAEKADKQAVALKILYPDAAADTELLARFQREARIGKRIAHKHAVKCIEVAKHGGYHYTVMELVTGGDLSQVLKSKGKIDSDDSMRYAVQLAEVLARLVKVGVVHRDIKPANIMLDSEGHIKLADFGLAKLLDDEKGAIPVDSIDQDLTQAGTQIGTPAFMPPEQIMDAADAGPTADVYSFGTTVYTLFAGQRPFPGKSAMQVLEAVANTRPDHLWVHAPQSPAALDELLDWCMEKRPNKRPRDGIHLLELICQIQRQPDNIKAIRELRRASQSGQGKLLMLVIIGMLGVMVFALIAWFLLQAL